MKLPTILRTSFLLCGVAAFVLSTGCKHKTPDGTEGNLDDVTDGGEMLGADGWENGDSPMTSANFQELPRITDVSFAPVYFGYNNYQLEASEYGKMDDVANYLQSNARAVLVVEGHCDERGTEEYNMSLGEYRAQSVRDYLIRSGIDAERIQTASFGESRPAVPGSGEAAWSRNRRGEFALYSR